MKISLGFLFTITGIIDYILWSMGKIPYGALCWVAPLSLGILFEIIECLRNN